MFDSCTQMADAAKMTKNKHSSAACLLPGWLAAAAKGRALGFGPRVASSERANERYSDENKHQQQQQQRGAQIQTRD
jgi:hypothetical protein